MDKLKILVIAAAAASLCASCVKPESSGLNDGNKRYLDAWMKINHPEAIREGMGIYILDETAGAGTAFGNPEDYPYAYVSYTSSDLDGNIQETTDADIAKQVGTYNDASYYGPVVKLRSITAFTAGQEMVLSPMRVGGTRKAVIPGWFATLNRYDTEKEYLDQVTGDDCIYTVTVHDVIKDITQWQIDSIARYLTHQYSHAIDSTKFGFYYIQTKEPVDTTSFDSSAKVYVNYTGSLLNGKVFDTSDANTAKDAGLYSSSKTYEPMEVTLNSDYKEIQGVIEGIALCVSRMKKGEKGTCVFYSGIGYQGESKTSIPAFSPLRFDLEMLGTSKN